MNICIIGGGNIGTLIMGDIGRRKDVSIGLLTSKPSKWSHTIEVYTKDNNVKHVGNIDIITDKPEEILPNADIIISTVPSHIFPEYIKKIEEHINPNTWIGIMPGSGGSEFYCKKLIDRNCLFFGFQRVPGVARIKKYGKSVYDLGKRNELHIATIPSNRVQKVCHVMSGLLEIKCTALPNYLNVTLTPSNPILHTARLYSMFHDYEEGIYWDKEIGFYDDWNNDASQLLLECDNELQNMCRMLTGLDLTGVRSLKEHYESDTPKQMSAKIQSISGFKNIKTPMLLTEKGFIPDFQSRYFLEDFSYGLCIIKGFCDVVGVNTPCVDKVLMWYEDIAKIEYYINGLFRGKDLKDLPLPQNYGLNSIDKIVAYYQ